MKSVTFNERINLSVRLLMKLALPATVGVFSLSASAVQAQTGTICDLTVVLRIGGDDVRGNTTIKVSAGGQSFLVGGGIGNSTTAKRNGQFPRCVPESALSSGGIELTSISNPVFPETTDNWNMDGVAIYNTETGRLYYRSLAPAGTYRHRFSGERPTWRTGGVVVSNTPFMERRYAQCFGTEAFVKFGDPSNPSRPRLNVTIRRPGSTTSVPAVFDSTYGDWGGSVRALGITNVLSTTLEFIASAPDRRTGTGLLYPNCSPIGL